MKQVRKGQACVRLTAVAALLILPLLMMRPSPVYACSCVDSPSVEVALAKATAVFAGRVTAVDPLFMSMSGRGDTTVTFAVSQVWKGPQQRTLTLSTPGSGAACGYGFIKNERYLVYASDGSGTLQTSSCSRTVRYDDAAGDLAALGPATAVMRSSRLPADVATVFWVVTGLFLILAGLFAAPLNRWLTGAARQGELFTVPRFRRAAQLNRRLSRVVLICLGLGLLLNSAGYLVLAPITASSIAFLLLGVAVLGILLMIGITLYNWRA